MKKGFFIVLLCLSYNCLAQFQTWFGVELGLKPFKAANFSISLQQRQINLTQWNRSLLYSSFSYKPIKGIKPFIEYRCSAQSNPYPELNSKQTYYKHRWALGIDFSIIDWFDKNSRLKLDWTFQQQCTVGLFQRENSITRNKGFLLYDINNFKLSPFISAEHYYNWKRDIVYTEDEIITIGGTSNLRYITGLEIEISKTHAIQVSFGIQKNFLSDKKTYIGILKYKVDIK